MSSATRSGELLHARRQVRILPHRRVIHMQIVANGPHHHLAGVEPHPQLQQHAVRAAHLLGIRADGALQGEGRIARPQGMIFVGNGRPKRAIMPSPSTWLTVPS